MRPCAPFAARRLRATALVVLAGALLWGCESNGVEGGLDFERMVIQPKGDAYEASGLFPDGKVMRKPPEHVVAREERPVDPVRRTGKEGGTGAWVARSPLGYSPPLLERGRDRFGVYCTPCHGFDGYAGTPVGEAMELKAPPSLHDPSIRALSDGFIYGVVRGGYGLMPSYANQLPERDRWAVVAYVRALQLSQWVALDGLSPGLRDTVLSRLAPDSVGGTAADSASPGGAR